MKFGIISDTHDNPENIHKAKIVFSDHKVSYVVHLGDYVAPFIFRLFDGMKIFGVFGNNDGDRVRLLGVARDIGAEIKGDFYEFSEDGLSFACYHGTEQPLTSALIKSGTYDVVMCGHTHEAAHETVGTTIFINPGTAHGFGKRASVAVFDTTTRAPEFIDL
jgi:uncharacterized protein